MSEPERWGVEWRSTNRLDGRQRYFMWDRGHPALFRTRREARSWIREKYGYIAQRRDLWDEPHGWQMPQPVRVNVILIEDDELLRRIEEELGDE